MLRLGMVDCDSGHAIEFPERLNHVDIAADEWVHGARVVAAVPMTSLIEQWRVDESVPRLRQWGIEILDRPEDLLGRVDAVLIESQDGSVHLDRALPFIDAGLPIFIDKPFTTSTADARRLVEAAQARGVTLFSASSIRYAMEVQDLLRRRDETGAILGADVYSVAITHPRNPGLFHYAVHAVEPLFTMLGTGCQSVRCIWEEGSEVVVGRWSDGRLGTIRGLRQGKYEFGITAFCEKAVVSGMIGPGSYFYRELLKIVVDSFTNRYWPLPPDQLIEPVAFQEAALLSSQRGGAEIRLDSL